MPSPRTEQLQIAPIASEVTERLLLRLDGELDLATAALLRARLREFDAQALTLDLTGVSFTDSTGLAILLEARTRARRSGTTLRIRGASGQTRELLERTGVLTLLEGPTDPA